MPQYNHRYIIAIAFISALGGYLFGFDFAVISGALPFLREQFQLTDWWEGFLTGSLALGCMAGCLLAGSVTEKYGRKPGLLLAAAIFAVSSVAIAFSQTLGFFIVMRFAAGIGVGMASMLCPMYIAEISPAAVRGRNVAINQLTIVIGILITNLINYLLAKQGAESWRWMFGAGVVPSVLFLLGVWWLPESPRWLIKKGRGANAQAVLEKLGSPSFAENTRLAIEQSLLQMGESSYRAVARKDVRPAVTAAIALVALQQFCGINVVFNYTSIIFASAGATVDRQLLETVSIGIVNLLFTLLAMALVDKLGRRPLMLFGTAGLSVIYIILALLLQVQSAAWLLSVFVLLAISVYAMSLAPVTWVLIAEIFPNKIRSAATALAVVCLWAAYFILVFTFPFLARQLGTFGPFYMYAAICVLGCWFVFKQIKETRGKTLEELEENLKHH